MLWKKVQGTLLRRTEIGKGAVLSEAAAPAINFNSFCGWLASKAEGFVVILNELQTEAAIRFRLCATADVPAVLGVALVDSRDSLNPCHLQPFPPWGSLLYPARGFIKMPQTRVCHDISATLSCLVEITSWFPKKSLGGDWLNRDKSLFLRACIFRMPGWKGSCWLERVYGRAPRSPEDLLNVSYSDSVWFMQGKPQSDETLACSLFRGGPFWLYVTCSYHSDTQWLGAKGQSTGKPVLKHFFFPFIIINQWTISCRA